MNQVRLYFKKTEVRSDGKVALMAQFNYGGVQNRIRISEVFPVEKIKSNTLQPGKDVLLNEVAKRVRAKFSLIEIEMEKAKTQGLPVVEHIKRILATKEPERANKIDFIELYEKWIELSKSRISNQTNQKLSPNTIRTYNIVLTHLKEMDKIYPLDITKMDKSFYQAFNKYIIGKKELSANAFGKYIAILKVFMRWAEEILEEKNIEVSTKYQRFKAPKKYMGVQHLRSFDLKKFQNFSPDKTGISLNLQNHYEALEQSNDLFLMMCYTGLSVSDLKTLTRKNIQIDRIVIKRGKTSNECIIPFFDDEVFKPVELFKKYNFKLPEVADQNINLHIKEVAEMVKFDRFVLTTKIGRKTFATIKHLEQKVPSQIVMKATGHTTERAFLRYIGTDHDAVIESFQDNAQHLKGI